MLQVDLPALGSQFRLSPSHQNDPCPWFASIAILVAGAAWQLTPSRAEATIQRGIRCAVLRVQYFGRWWCNAEPRTGRRKKLSTQTMTPSYYTDGASSAGLLIATTSRRARARASTPAVVVPGWLEVSMEDDRNRPSIPSGKPLMVNRAVIQKGLDRQLVYDRVQERGRSCSPTIISLRPEHCPRCAYAGPD